MSEAVLFDREKMGLAIIARNGYIARSWSSERVEFALFKQRANKWPDGTDILTIPPMNE
jgi:hypothetical protein